MEEDGVREQDEGAEMDLSFLQYRLNAEQQFQGLFCHRKWEGFRGDIALILRSMSSDRFAA